MPIGNLTSQIFANIYLNEFDRFVRHKLKPNGYVRYGDDFVMFLRTQGDAENFRDICKNFLENELYLKLHPHNNVVIRTTTGIHFLGHRIYPSSIVIAPIMRRKIYQQISSQNAASYRSQALPRRLERDIPWLIMENKLF